ncbi:MAG: ABC transporter ATP-binding protein [Bacteroidales bacterium]
MYININNLSKSYNNNLVLDHFSLELKPGQTYFLIGKNGAGKSTLINSIMDIIPKDEGDVYFDDNNKLPIPNEIKSQIGILSEEAFVIEELSLKSYLEFVARIYGLSKKEANMRIESLVDYFYDNPDEVLKKSISSFSTGMKKRAGIIASIIHTPDFLILDEPFSGLDPMFSQTLIEFLQKYQNGQRTILISSHNLMYLEKFATHLCIIDEGKIKLNCSIDEFTQHGERQLSDSLFDILKREQKENSLSWM